MLHPQTLRAENLARPIHIWSPEGVDYAWLQTQYLAGQLERMEASTERELKPLQPGQILIAPIDPQNPRLHLLSKIGMFYIYEWR